MSSPGDDEDDDDFDKDLEEAAAITDAELAATLSLPKGLMESICPTPVDRQKLMALLQAVNAATSENEAQKKLVEGLANCGAVIVRLLRKIVIP